MKNIKNRLRQRATRISASLLLGCLLTLLLAAGFAQQLDFDSDRNGRTYENLLPLAELGDPDAQNAIGFMHYRGAGVPQDFTKAHDWFHQAAESGSIAAQRNLGLFHSGALPLVPAKFHDMEEANEWLKLVALYAPANNDTPDSSSSTFGKRAALASIEQRTDPGSTLFMHYCAGCHGFDGVANFKQAPSFAFGERLDKPLDELIHSITNGLDKMPAWKGTLDKNSIRQVAAFIKEHFGDPERVALNKRELKPLLPDLAYEQNPKLRDGEEIYQHFCVGCHGFNGIAHYVYSPSFALGERTLKSDMVLRRSIAKGIGAMPGWENKLSPYQIDALMAYLRKLAALFEGTIEEDWSEGSEFYFKFRPLGARGAEWDRADPGGSIPAFR